MWKRSLKITPLSSKPQGNIDPLLQFNYVTYMVTNAGPPINNVDSTLTVKAPYSQSDITVFGANAGQQCVSMRLCALIYTTIHGINKCNDLVQIMEMVPSILRCHSMQGRCI